MTSFLGEYECKVDDKGRILIPAALKKQISSDAQEKFVINRGFEKHLTLYPMNEWNIISATVNKLNLFEKKNRLFVRMFHNGATELEMDNANRILLPKTLCKDVMIEKEVILFAYSNRIEVWSKKEYENMLKDESVDFASLAEEVMEAQLNPILPMQYHNPVLLQDCIDGLNIKPDGVYVDVTFGGGGHSREILKHLTTGKLIAFDQDADAIENKPDNANLILINQNFRYLKNYLRLHQVTQIDGLLADLGVSSHQFDVAERGFSIRFDADLDMRMNKNATLTAKQILNTYEEAKLVTLFKEYGEVINAKFLVKLICEYRSQQSINTVDQFKQLIKRATPRQKENQFLAQVFQALRIEVNDELQVLKEMLEQAVDLLKPSGRLVVMSYHSLEDKLVKNYIKQGKFFGEAEKDFFGNVTVPLKQITRKPIVPADVEVLTNSRARSAKLRIAEKI